ncbi:hypothetical protein, variant [Aphanomyces invadans]|uniref:tRNA (guanine(46)-N(7))-methyltransferase n=1 Tax=Aphanomyces invadans TaxID=157072 RepID=A0A024UEI8_9STRA|nr:hypothetical protein, variant [Aphanomyces invadans]ETW04033.1 hypothetical protein, variant [Aphanomyces invadans]|eukprot:XP_008866989.1 hypothetical protein, variant [Aphanomyces invadans]
MARTCVDSEAAGRVSKKQKMSSGGTSTMAKPTIDWKKTPSFPPAEGSCTVWLPRKQRYCSHHATFGSTKCTTHAALDTAPPGTLNEAVLNTNEDADDATTEDKPPEVTSRKTNLDRHLKRMLNPFSILPLKEAPVWSELFSDPSLPLCIDIGCSKGLYIRDYRDKKQLEAHWNFLGVEIFEPYVAAANAATRQHQSPQRTKNLAYVHANINNSLETLLSGIHQVGRVSLLFPDPWGCGLAKDHKNKKRRVMSAAFAKRLANAMPLHSEFYLASDYEDLARDIRAHLLATGGFNIPVDGPYVPTLTASAIRQSYENKKLQKERLLDTTKAVGKVAMDSDASTLWLATMPLGVPTERDVICENQWRPVYRLVLIRNGTAVPPSS